MPARAKRLIRLLLLLLLLAFAGLNLAAFLHARAMTHFVPGGTKTKAPAELGLTEKLWVLLDVDAFACEPVLDAHRVRCPTLILAAGDDPFVYREESEAIHVGLSGPKRLVYFEGAGHESLLAREPDRWRSELRTLLAPLAR